MRLRGLHLPTRRTLLGSAFVIISLVTLTHVGWAMKQGLAEHGLGLTVSLGVSAACLLLVVGVIDGLHRLQAAGWSFEEPRLSRWIVFYGVWGLAGMVIGLGRVIQRQLQSGAPLPVERAAFVVLTCLYVTLAMIWACENQAMFRRVVARKQESSRRAVAYLFRAREVFIKARDRQRHEALDLLDRQIEPELEAVQRELERLVADGKDGRAFERLARRLDHVRDTEVRRLSHLLHPSIIDMGLAPALRSLARRYGDALTIRLELDPPSLEGLSPDARLQLYRIAEQSLDRLHDRGVGEMRLLLSRAADGAIQLEIAAGAVPDAWDGAERALLEARVGLLGGTWSVDRDEGGIVLRVSAPPAAKSALRE